MLLREETDATGMQMYFVGSSMNDLREWIRSRLPSSVPYLED